MKIKPSADFPSILAEPEIQQAELDAPAMQAESVHLTLAQVLQASRFANN